MIISSQAEAAETGAAHSAFGEEAVEEDNQTSCRNRAEAHLFGFHGPWTFQTSFR